MSTETVVTLYFIGRTADEAVKGGEPYVYEDSAQEDAGEDEKVFKINLTVFSSRVKEVSRWE